MNAGVRATFGAVHGTLRSQGSAIRGLEELIKKMLPELDRISASDKEKAEAAEVERIAADVAKLDEEAREARSLRVEAVNGLEGKFDAKLGQRALEALARQQHQAEQEAAAREAVGNEVVRLAASCASFSQLVEAVNSEARKADPRLTALERRTEAAEATIATSHDEMVRRLAGKAESKVVEGLAQDVTEAAEAVQRRWAKAEGLTRKCHAEAMKAVGERMERKEAQQALDALAEQVACSCVHAYLHMHACMYTRVPTHMHACLAEQVARQAYENAQAGARMAEAMSARVERAEAAAHTAQNAVEAEAAEGRAELQSQIAALQLALDTATTNAQSQLRMYAAGADREKLEIEQKIEKLGEAQAEATATLKGEVGEVARGVKAIEASGARTSEELEELSKALGELQPSVARLGAKGKSQSQMADSMTSQLQVCTERIETAEDRLTQIGSALSVISASPQPASADELAALDGRMANLERALTGAVDELRQRQLEKEREQGMGLQFQHVADMMRSRLEQVEAQVIEERDAAAKRDDEARRAANAAESAANAAAAATVAAESAAAAAATPRRAPTPPPPPPASPPPVPPTRAGRDDEGLRVAVGAATSAEAAAKSSAVEAGIATRVVESLQKQLSAYQSDVGELTSQMAALRAEHARDREASVEAVRLVMREELAVVTP